jgi:microsomal dipeptidase-like Zn-dependent dipeptidase
LDDISQLPVITEEMARRGYTDETITKVLGGNLLRVFETVLGG